MKLTFNTWYGSERLSEIFGAQATGDGALDSQELAAAGLSAQTLAELGITQDAALEGTAKELVLGTALRHTLGLRPAASRTERKLDAEILGVFADWTDLKPAEIGTATAAIMALPEAEKRRALVFLRACGDDWMRRQWIRNPSSAARAVELFAALAKVPNIKPTAFSFFDGLPENPAEAVELFKSLAPTLGSDEARLMAAGQAHRIAVTQGISGAKAQRDAVLFVDKYITRKPDVLAYLTAGGFELASASTTTLARDAAAALTKQLAGGQSPGTAAVVIDEIHDRQGANGGGDSYREGIIGALPSQAIASILSGATSEMYPSTYNKSLGRARALAPNGDMAAWLEAVDPNGEMTSGFLDTFAHFRQSDVVGKASDVFVDEVLARATAGDGDMQYVQLAVGILKQGTDAARAKLGEKLVELLKQPDGASGRTIAGLILRTAVNEGAALPADVKTVAARLPALPKNEAPVSEWLADGAVTAVLFCYPEGGGAYPSSIAAYYEGQGFVEKAVRAPFGLDRKLTRVFEKEVNGVIQRLVITSDQRRDRNEVIADAGVDIVVHRGHSYQLDQTFPGGTMPEGARKKLLFGGSCWSAGTMTSSSFQESYGGHLVLSDSDVGQARVNNPALLKVLNGVTSRKKSFRSYALEGNGIVLPDSPELLLHAYKGALAGFEVE